MIAVSEYRKRRAMLMSMARSPAVIIVPAAPTRVRSVDPTESTHFEFEALWNVRF